MVGSSPVSLSLCCQEIVNLPVRSFLFYQIVS